MSRPDPERTPSWLPSMQAAGDKPAQHARPCPPRARLTPRGPCRRHNCLRRAYEKDWRRPALGFTMNFSITAVIALLVVRRAQMAVVPHLAAFSLGCSGGPKRHGVRGPRLRASTHIGRALLVLSLPGNDHRAISMRLPPLSLPAGLHLPCRAAPHPSAP